MQIEQRLGRIHRIGQTHDVELTNLVARGTIEERILEVLHSKLNLFELVIGELDMVLGRVSDDFDFEDAVFDAHVASHDDAELADRFDALGEAMLQARADHADSRSRTDELVDELEGSVLLVREGAWGVDASGRRDRLLREVCRVGGRACRAGSPAAPWSFCPTRMQSQLQLAEEIGLTEDPEVAREDGTSCLPTATRC